MATTSLPPDARGHKRTWFYEVPGKVEEGEEASVAVATSSGETEEKSVVPAEPLDVILFYKYVVIDAKVVSAWQQELCTSLGLSGRVLVSNEGVNGTLAGTEAAIAAYTAAMDKHEAFGSVDWKHSSAKTDPFPDLHVKVVKEVISTGGVIPNDFSNAGVHLDPSQFHDKLAAATADDTVVLDVRNYQEYAVGRFQGAIRSDMRTFTQFPKFIDDNVHRFKDKKVLMYCTGGIRCEKASAYLKANGIEEVYQLKGGIHRYLERFPDGGLFKGKNFVFDKRVALGPPGVEEGKAEVVGRCEYCESPFDELSPTRVCTVCRDMVLCCPKCEAKVSELHCQRHEHLRDVYFTFLDGFSVDELSAQKQVLKAMLAKLLGRSNKNKRRTLTRQITKIDNEIRTRLQAKLAASTEDSPATTTAPTTTATTGAAVAVST